MKIQNDTINCLKSIRLHPVTSVLIGFFLIITSCNDKPMPYPILEFTMGNQVADSANPIVLLAKDGDLIQLNEIMFYYRQSSQNKFHLKNINGVVYINDKILSITIPGNDDMIPWFKQMKSTDLSELQFLDISSKPQEGYIPYLNELTKIKPDISLSSYSENLDDMAKLIENFNPRFIIGATLSQKDFNLLSGFTNLELLWVYSIDSSITIPLPAMPRLKQLQLINMDNDFEINNDLLINNKQLEKLIIMQQGSFDFSLIEPLSNLKELSVTGYDTIKNSDLIKNHKNLEVLSLSEGNFKYNQTFNKLAGIRWISFSPDVTQDEFNTFIEYHPNLEVMEIAHNKKIRNLQPLKELKKIYGLTVRDTLTDIATIKTLKNLKYLSLPKEVLQDSLLKAELQKLLPDTRIVANEGTCLGSGWLILIIPFILLFRAVNQKKSGKVRDSN